MLRLNNNVSHRTDINRWSGHENLSSFHIESSANGEAEHGTVASASSQPDLKGRPRPWKNPFLS